MAHHTEEQDTVIAIVGAGKGGTAILKILLQIPGVTVRYVCDKEKDSGGMILAAENGIELVYELENSPIVADNTLDLIFEVTGSKNVFEYLQEKVSQNCTVVGAAGAKVLFYLLESQQNITEELRYCKLYLSEKVMERTEELEETNRELQRKVNELAGLNQKLHQINEEKTKYLVNATHQLKAPFAAIQSYSELLINGYADDLSEKSETIVKKIRDRCILLSNSIKEMLELANLNSFVEENLKMVKENLNTIASAQIERFKPVADSKNIRLLFNPCEREPVLTVNKKQIEALFHILIENAINYSHHESSIFVEVGCLENKRVYFSVKDQGIGIEEKNLKNIFREYFRTNRAVRQSYNGSGLGLAIAKRIAELHRAEISVDSIPGKGSLFIVEFPLQSLVQE